MPVPRVPVGTDRSESQVPSTIVLAALVFAALGAGAGLRGEGGRPISYLAIPVTDRETAADPEWAAAVQEVALAAARLHNGLVAVPADATDDAISALLLTHRPEVVLIILPPWRLDLALHRRVLSACIQFDDDPLLDAAVGYMTAGTPDALRALWARSARVHCTGMTGRGWTRVSVARGIESCVIPDAGTPHHAAAGFAVRQIYLGERESDARVLERARAWLPGLADASVIEFLGNGDPQGVWLFSDARNARSDLHWPFDPARIGHDPDGTMPRLRAADIRALRLSAPIVWSGTCHSAVVQRALVASDIVATFGTTERVTICDIPPDTSFALAVIDAGAAALLAPLGPNHGFAVWRETQSALSTGDALGEVIRATANDALLAAAADGRPIELTPPVAGSALRRHPVAEVMRLGLLNRILIGDPALRPFRPAADPQRRVEARSRDGMLEVVVRMEQGLHPTSWAMAEPGHRGARIVASIDLGAVDPIVEVDDRPLVSVSVRRSDGDDDAPIAVELRYAVVEQHRGRRILHLQANSTIDLTAIPGHEVTFRVLPGDAEQVHD